MLEIGYTIWSIDSHIVVAIKVLENLKMMISTGEIRSIYWCYVG
jgi:hypothetical protein